MGGLILIAILMIWFYVALMLSAFLGSKMRAGLFKTVMGFVLFPLILLAPVADELIGREIFYSECEKLEPVQFFGAASIGEGHFFNSDGTPKWSTDEEFKQLRMGKNAIHFRSEIKSIKKRYVLKRFPIQIEARQTEFFGDKTHAIILKTRTLYSRGGWINGNLLGSWYSYSCSSKGAWPSDKHWIKF